jgi:type 1 glutamine amidotransferase
MRRETSARIQDPEWRHADTTEGGLVPLSSSADPTSLKGRTMRTFAIFGATLAMVGVLGTGLGACSDGGGDLPVGKAGSSSSTAGTSSTGDTASTGGSASTAGTGSVVPPVGGSGAIAGSTGVGGNDTGGMPVVTGGSSSGGMTTTAGTGSGGMPTGGTGAGGSTGSGLRTGPFKMLMMSNALEFAHTSIPNCTKMLKDLGAGSAPERATITGLAADSTWTVDETNPKGDLSEVTAENLQAHEIFYSNNPTGKVFTNATGGAMKKQAFQTFMDNGGAWAGQHSASDFEKNGSWPWFQDKVVGGWFVDHNGPTTSGTIAWEPDYAQHPILKGLTSPWNVIEEWYVMNRDIAAVAGFKVLAKVTTSGFGAYPNATVRPAIWITENAKGGRAFYTIRGHNESAYAEPQFRELMLRGILWSVHRLPGGN